MPGPTRRCPECGGAIPKALLVLCDTCYGARPGVNGIRLVAKPGESLPSSLQYEYEDTRTRFIGIRQEHGDAFLYYSYTPSVYARSVPSLELRARTPSPRSPGR